LLIASYTILTNADLVRTEDLAQALASLNLKRKTIQFYFADDHWKEDHHHHHAGDTYVLRGKINSLGEDFTNELSGVTYKTRLDTSDSWVIHENLSSLQRWINGTITGNESKGIKYWIKCTPKYKPGQGGDAINLFNYNVS
jgi:hypothetical protein